MKTLLLFGALAFGLNALGQANNYSLSFDGFDDYVELPASYDIPNKSVSLTFKLNSYPVSDLAMLYNSISAVSTTNGLNQIAIRQDSTLGFQVGNNNNQGNPEIFVPLDTWLNVCLTIGNSYNHLYVDGVLLDSVAADSSPGNSTMDIITFGCFKSNQGTLRYFDGLFNRVSIWSIELSNQEIIDYINCPPIGNEIGLIGYWNLEEGAGTIAGDITSNGNDGVLTNAPTWSTNVPAFNCGVGMEELIQSEKELVKIIDFMGRETEFKPNTPLIFIYSDGTRERVMKIEE